MEGDVGVAVEDLEAAPAGAEAVGGLGAEGASLGEHASLTNVRGWVSVG
jgi:hypothetical protein